MQKQHSNYRYSSQLKTSLLVALLVMLVGIVSAISPFGRWLEEDIGLPWLFKLRGKLPAPDEVAIISIDQNSAKRLNLPAKPRKWPRHYHGQLVDLLSAHGASAIGFDIIFDEEREPEQNRQFAEAMRRANNVVLFQYIQQEEVRDQQNGISQGRIKKLISPIPTLAQSAQGLAPFPLPIVPAKKNHFTLYEESLGGLPTLPVTMLQLHAQSVHADLIELINLFEPGIALNLWQTMSSDITDAQQHDGIQNISIQFRDLFRRHPKLAGQIKQELILYQQQGHLAFLRNKPDDKKIKLLRTLLNMYTAPKNLYLNFYGGLGSIQTIPYYKALSSDPDNPSIDIKNKAVFVGFSEQFQPAQKDAFYTVFTEAGTDISGVEIIATAFANLLEQNAISVPSGQWEIFILMGWGLLVSLLLRFGSALLQIPITIILAMAYGGIVYYSFTNYYLWLPFLNPILIQLLLASLLLFLWKYRQVQLERSIIRDAFGYHLPVDVVDQIAKGVNHVTGPGEKVHGIIMATDAQQYTTLSETLGPDKLHTLMNEYYKTLFKPIRDNNGIVSDVVGDAAMAIWANPVHSKTGKINKIETNQQHQQACLAALAAQRAIDQFNQANPDYALPTRIGLDSGEIVMGHIGALDHYEYRAIGDIVNTASRIEGVNKFLGTRIIVSASVLAGTNNFVTRKLGRFKLAGKQSATTLYELLGHGQEGSKINHSMLDNFAQGLKYFQSQDWQAGYALFKSNQDDGPSRYYMDLCNFYISNAPQQFDGSVELQNK